MLSIRKDFLLDKELFRVGQCAYAKSWKFEEIKTTKRKDKRGQLYDMHNSTLFFLQLKHQKLINEYQWTNKVDELYTVKVIFKAIC